MLNRMFWNLKINMKFFIFHLFYLLDMFGTKWCIYVTDIIKICEVILNNIFIQLNKTVLYDLIFKQHMCTAWHCNVWFKFQTTYYAKLFDIHIVEKYCNMSANLFGHDSYYIHTWQGESRRTTYETHVQDLPLHLFREIKGLPIDTFKRRRGTRFKCYRKSPT